LTSGVYGLRPIQRDLKAFYGSLHGTSGEKENFLITDSFKAGRKSDLTGSRKFSDCEKRMTKKGKV